MSIEAITYVKGLPAELTSPELLLLIVIGENTFNDTGRCVVGQAVLIDDTRMSERSVRRHLTGLEQRGLVKVEARYLADGGRDTDAILISGFPDWLEGHKGARRRAARETPKDESNQIPAKLAGSPPLPANLAGSPTGHCWPVYIEPVLDSTYTPLIPLSASEGFKPSAIADQEMAAAAAAFDRELQQAGHPRHVFDGLIVPLAILLTNEQPSPEALIQAINAEFGDLTVAEIEALRDAAKRKVARFPSLKRLVSIQEGLVNPKAANGAPAPAETEWITPTDPRWVRLLDHARRHWPNLVPHIQAANIWALPEGVDL